MDLLREWRRRIVGGTVAVVVVPVIVVVGALGVIGTGFGGLDSLGQALTGPEIPASGPALADETSDADDAGSDLLADVAVATPAATAGPRRAAARRRAARRRSGSGQRPAATPTPDATRPPSTGGGGGGGGEPQPTPTPEPSTVRQVGDTVKSVTDQVPIAGEPAGQVVDTIVDTAEQLPLPNLP